MCVRASVICRGFYLKFVENTQRDVRLTSDNIYSHQNESPPFSR